MFLLLHRHYMVSKNTFLGTDLKTKKIEIAEKKSFAASDLGYHNRMSTYG